MKNTTRKKLITTDGKQIWSNGKGKFSIQRSSVCWNLVAAYNGEETESWLERVEDQLGLNLVWGEPENVPCVFI